MFEGNTLLERLLDMAISARSHSRGSAAEIFSFNCFDMGGGG
jgi:hypothetical protein